MIQISIGAIYQAQKHLLLTVHNPANECTL